MHDERVRPDRTQGPGHRRGARARRRDGRALARAGAAVVIADIREDLGKATADALKKSGAAAAFLPLDVTNDASWELAIDGHDRRLGGLDILVNNAGVEISSLVIDLDPDDIRKMLEVNILGTALGIKHAFRAMRPGGPAGRAALWSTSPRSPPPSPSPASPATPRPSPRSTG